MENNDLLAVNSAAVGQNIRNARLAAGYTIDELAKQLGLSFSYIGLIERGERCPSLHTLMGMCRIFSLTPNDVLCGDIPPEDVEQNKSLKISAMLNSFSNKELDFVIEMLKQMNKLRY